MRNREECEKIRTLPDISRRGLSDNSTQEFMEAKMDKTKRIELMVRLVAAISNSPLFDEACTATMVVDRAERILNEIIYRAEKADQTKSVAAGDDMDGIWDLIATQALTNNTNVNLDSIEF